MMSQAKFFTLAAALLLALPLASVNADDCCGGCGGHDHATASESVPGDIVDLAASAGSFETLVAAVKAAGLVETLKGEGPFTVFAPSDAAFAKLPEGTVASLLKDKEALTAILTYHVVPGRFLAADLAGKNFLATAQGQSLKLNLSSDGAMVDGARIVKTDILAKNGVIHVIDSVVLPRKDIVGVAGDAGTFKTLLAAAEAAGLVDTLKGKGPFTIFAPTDAAFAKLPAGTVEALLKDKAKLAAILTYHVIPGRVLSTDLPKKALSVKTVNGQNVEVSRSDKGVSLNGSANVVTADVLAGNGVIHVIDSVILPR